MDQEITMPVVTEDDVLAGQKPFFVRTRQGTTVNVRVKALPWRTALMATALDPGAATIAVLQHCLPKEFAKDEFLDSIVPMHVVWMATVAMQLSNGVDEAKKKAGEQRAGSRVKTTDSPHDFGTSSPSSAS